LSVGLELFEQIATEFVILEDGLVDTFCRLEAGADLLLEGPVGTVVTGDAVVVAVL